MQRVRQTRLEQMGDESVGKLVLRAVQANPGGAVQLRCVGDSRGALGSGGGGQWGARRR